jgi:hypothetical protein
MILDSCTLESGSRVIVSELPNGQRCVTYIDKKWMELYPEEKPAERPHTVRVRTEDGEILWENCHA